MNILNCCTTVIEISVWWSIIPFVFGEESWWDKEIFPILSHRCWMDIMEHGIFKIIKTNFVQSLQHACFFTCLVSCYKYKWETKRKKNRPFHCQRKEIIQTWIWRTQHCEIAINLEWQIILYDNNERTIFDAKWLCFMNPSWVAIGKLKFDGGEGRGTRI